MNKLNDKNIPTPVVCFVSTNLSLCLHHRAVHLRVYTRATFRLPHVLINTLREQLSKNLDVYVLQQT